MLPLASVIRSLAGGGCDVRVPLGVLDLRARRQLTDAMSPEPTVMSAWPAVIVRPRMSRPFLDIQLSHVREPAAAIPDRKPAVAERPSQRTSSHLRGAVQLRARGARS